jgi:hypothetical protein
MTNNQYEWPFASRDITQDQPDTTQLHQMIDAYFGPDEQTPTINQDAIIGLAITTSLWNGSWSPANTYSERQEILQAYLNDEDSWTELQQTVASHYQWATNLPLPQPITIHDLAQTMGALDTEEEVQEAMEGTDIDNPSIYGVTTNNK